MNKVIKLPNGDAIAADAIRAIRLGDARPKGVREYESELKPRVIVDFVVGGYVNCIVLDCDSTKERDDLAARLKSQWVN